MGANISINRPNAHPCSPPLSSSDKPALPSDGETQSCHYNIACMHAALGDIEAGLAAVGAAIAAGYDDGATLDADPDLAPLRADGRWNAVTARVPRRKAGGGGLFGGLFGGGR